MQTSVPLLNVATIVPRTEAEGPGVRFAVWVQGCPMRCPGCCNPELLRVEPRRAVEPLALAREAIAQGVEGVSLLGGEPMAQAAALAVFAAEVRRAGLSVMVFSGYTLAEIEALGDDARALLGAADLLVDGRYEAARRTRTRRWIGSDNQVMHFLTPRYDPTDPRFFESNQVEIRLAGGQITVNGWPVHGGGTLVRPGRSGDRS